MPTKRAFLPYLKVLLVLLFICLSLFFIDTYLYQQLVNQDSEIADEECLYVNPLLIARKSAFITNMNYLKTSKDASIVLAGLKKYNDITKQFNIAQDIWLQTDSDFMKKWQYKYLLPKNWQLADSDLFQSRLADLNASVTLVSLFSTTDPETQNQLDKKIAVQDALRDKYDAAYQKLLDEGQPFDPRNYFIHAPLSKCPAKNFNIPDTNQVFSTPTPQPVMAPDIPGST